MGADQSSLSDDASADENFFKKLNCGGLRAKGDGKQTSIKPFVYSSTVGTDEGIPVLSRADMKRVALSPGFPQRTRRALWSKLIVDSCRDLGLDVEGLSAEWKAIDTSHLRSSIFLVYILLLRPMCSPILHSPPLPIHFVPY